LLAASFGGLVTALVVCPLDVVKTRMQVESSGSSLTHYNGTLDALVKIGKSEGILSLWRGVTPALTMAVPNAVIYFNSYEFMKQKLRENQITHAVVNPLLAGGTARVIAVSLLSPLELLRTNMQALDFQKIKQLGGQSTYGLLTGNSGLRGLWAGYTPTLIRDVPFSGIYWTGYEYIKSTLRNHIPNEHKKHRGFSFLVDFISGATSGSIAAILTTPIDVIKTNTQVSGLPLNPHSTAPSIRKTALEVARNILREEGWRGLVKGIVPRAAKVAPSCAIMISSYEFVKSIKLPF